MTTSTLPETNAMRYAPYPSEMRAIPAMSEIELMEYFLLRVFETEEVWAVRDGESWMLREHAGQTWLPVWPYRHFADEAVAGWAVPLLPVAQSLEFFINDTLQWLIDDDIGVAIMPCAQAPGCQMSPHRLLSIIEGMRDAGDYHLDA
jgi:hypothetical protein